MLGPQNSDCPRNLAELDGRVTVEVYHPARLTPQSAAKRCRQFFRRYSLGIQVPVIFGVNPQKKGLTEIAAKYDSWHDDPNGKANGALMGAQHHQRNENHE